MIDIELNYKKPIPANSEELIKKFQQWAQITRKEVIYYLERFNWNYDVASDYYWRTEILIW